MALDHIKMEQRSGAFVTPAWKTAMVATSIMGMFLLILGLVLSSMGASESYYRDSDPSDYMIDDNDWTYSGGARLPFLEWGLVSIGAACCMFVVSTLIHRRNHLVNQEWMLYYLAQIPKAPEQ